MAAWGPRVITSTLEPCKRTPSSAKLWRGVLGPCFLDSALYPRYSGAPGSAPSVGMVPPASGNRAAPDPGLASATLRGPGAWMGPRELGGCVPPIPGVTPLPLLLPTELLADGACNQSRGGRICSGWCHAVLVLGLKCGLGMLLECQDTVGCSAGPGVLQSTRGQQGPAAATTPGCSGGSEAFLWGPAEGGKPKSWSGEHPCILLGVSIPAPALCCSWSSPHLMGTGDTQSLLSCSSPHFLGPLLLVPRWICQRLPRSRAELSCSPPVPTVWLGIPGEGPPPRVALSHCAVTWGGPGSTCVRHGSACAWRVSAGRHPCAACPHCHVLLFLTPVSVCMCMLPFCNADADEGKVLFSVRLSLSFPSHVPSLVLSLRVTINLLPPPLPSPCCCVWQPRSVLPHRGGAVGCMWPSRDVSPCWGSSVPHTITGLGGPWAAAERGDPRSLTHGKALGSALQRHKAVHSHLL